VKNPIDKFPEDVVLKRTEASRILANGMTLTTTTPLATPKLSNNSRERREKKNNKGKRTNKNNSNRLGSKATIALRMEKEGWASKPYMFTKLISVSKKDGSGDYKRICIWCDACKTPVSAEKAVFYGTKSRAGHVNCATHIEKVQEWFSKQQNESNMRNSLRTFLRTHPTSAASTIDEETRLFRIEALRACLGAGIPYSKLNDRCLREFIEKYSGLRLTNSSHIANDIPFLLEAEKENLKAFYRHTVFPSIPNTIDVPRVVNASSVTPAVNKKNVVNFGKSVNFKNSKPKPVDQSRPFPELLIIFDSTSRVDECVAVIFRTVTEEFKIFEHLVELNRYERCKNGDEIANAIIRVIHDFNINFGFRIANLPSQIVAFQRDRAASNSAAVRNLMVSIYGAKDLKCFSHTLTHVGEASNMRRLKHLKETLCGYMNGNGGVGRHHAHWKDVFDRRWCNPGNTRWWATHELFMFLFNNWDLFLEFVTRCWDDDLIENGARMTNLHNMLFTDLVTAAWLKLECASIAIFAEPLIKHTYVLEGSSCCSFVAYDITDDARRWIQTHTNNVSYPGFDIAIQSCAESIRMYENEDVPQYAPLEQAIEIVKIKVRDMLLSCQTYFENRFVINNENNDEVGLSSDLQLYKFCRFFNPCFMKWRSDPLTRAQEFRNLFNDILNLRFNADQINQCVVELLEYVQLSADLIPDFDPLLYDGNDENINEELKNQYQHEMEESLKFWRNPSVRQRIPMLSKVARHCMIYVPSSASAERVFSILKSSFDIAQMQAALEDYTTVATIIRCNQNAEKHP
jgi:hypothetical protein